MRGTASVGAGRPGAEKRVTARRGLAAARQRTSLPAPWLETLRIALREFDPSDAEDLYQLDRDPRVVRYVSAGRPATRAETQATMRRILRYYRLYPDLGAWFATRRDTGAFIGWFCLKYAGRSPDIEIGYRLVPAAWGRGLATEGASALVNFGFDELGLHRIIGVTHRDNHASQRVLMKAGLDDCGWGRYYDMRLRLFAADNPHRAR